MIIIRIPIITFCIKNNLNIKIGDELKIHRNTQLI